MVIIPTPEPARELSIKSAKEVAEMVVAVRLRARLGAILPLGHLITKLSSQRAFKNVVTGSCQLCIGVIVSCRTCT